ncbi:MAG: GNAT family N-acetyltransferase [Anaerolineae bacterium]|nr:GNAT family N-acetyltransferase [Anaerolineae bacterium]
MASLNAAIRIQPATHIAFDALVHVFNTGYAAYRVPVQLDALDLRHHIEQNDIDLDASQVALSENQPVGMVLLGIRQPCAWIGGLGVELAHRRQGIARALMQAAIDEAHARSLASIQLEVIDDNTAASNLYRDLGFQTRRRLLVLEYPSKPLPASDVRPLEMLDARQISDLQRRLHPTPPPWQRQFGTPGSGAQLWVSPNADDPRAYALGFATDTRVHLLDIACAAGDEAILETLIRNIYQTHPSADGRLVNLGENERAWPVLEKLGWREYLAQFEMQLAL